MLYDLLASPFVDYGFMRRALAACACIAVGGAPLGAFLVLRRMTLIGDAMSHAILPGASLAFLFTGIALWPMTVGGLIAGLTVALLAGAIARLTPLKEDASFTGIYLLSLAIGVMIISVKGSTVDLIHVLFGNVLAVNNDSLLLVGSIATFSLLTLAVIYRPLVVECFDPTYLRTQHSSGAFYHLLFLVLVVLNLVSAFQALGTLMALGLMVLPAIAARMWTRELDRTLILSITLALTSTYCGLLISYHLNVPSGPAIVLVAGGIYIVSLLAGRHGGIMMRLLPHTHLVR